MRTTTSLIEERFGGECGQQTIGTCDSANRLAGEANIVSSTQGIGMVNREFLLRGSQLGMKEFDRNALSFQCGQNGIHHIRLLVQTVCAIAETVICWHILPHLLASKVKFVFSRRF